jgi:hypothetical protein
MTEEKLTEVAFEISNSLTALNTNMENVLKKMADHEHRICNLESYHPKEKNNDDFKTELLKLLAKGCVIGITVIGVLTGSGGIISKIFGL